VEIRPCFDPDSGASLEDQVRLEWLFRKSLERLVLLQGRQGPGGDPFAARIP